MAEKSHAYGDYHHLELNGRIKKRAIQQPARHRLAVRRALNELNLKYREAVTFKNPYWTGNRNQYPDGTLQWLDFVFQMPNKKIAVLLFDGHIGGGYNKRELRVAEAKLTFLQEKNIPVILLPTKYSSQEYRIHILAFIKRKEARCQ